MKKNLILNFSSLIVTAFLLVFLIFGWYVSNTEVEATGILGSTAGEEYEARLMKLDDNGIWVDCNDITFSNIEPGSIYYFKLILKSKTDKSLDLKVSFNELSSAIMDNKIRLENNSIINLKSGLPIYDVLDNKVMVNEVESDTSKKKTLYTITDGRIGLSDYKMHEAFMIYDLKNNEPNLNTEVSGGIKLSEGAGFNVLASKEENSYYFALEFNNSLSLKNIDGLISSNVYLFQTMKIGRISLLK